MITPMTKYSFVLLSGQCGSFLQEISGLGVVDITRSSKPADEASLAMLGQISAKKKAVAELTKGEDEHLKELRASLTATEKEADAARVWGEFDNEAVAALAEHGVHFHFYCVPTKKYDPCWAESLPIEIINELDGKTWFVVAGPESVPELPLKEITKPDESIDRLMEEVESCRKEIAAYQKQLEERRKEIPGLEAEITSLSEDLERHLASMASEKAAEGMITTMVGFAPTELDENLKETLDPMDIYWFSEPAAEDDNPPIKLKNNKFSSLFEVLTGMYGMPVYGEFDPTVFLSIFFLLFFAMCMGDAGYGILLIAIGFFLKGKEGGLAKLYKLIIALGAGTFVVGILLGAAFGVDLTTLSWIPDGLKKCMITGEVAGYSAQMVLALGVGIVHICLAMIMKAVWSIRRDGLKNSLSALGWTLLIVGTVIVLAFAIFGLVSETTAKWIIIGIAAVSALGIYIFNKIGRNPLMNIGSGLWDTYNMASGLMGDVLSYIRLYALGLSGGMLGSTFNSIGEMVKGPNPTWQWVPFVLILVVGHALNLAMSCLGAFVHPLRLNFVEFFKNSGYEGKGKGYRPLTNEKTNNK